LLYILTAANAFLVWSVFTFGHPGGTFAGRMALSLGYAFAPVMVALPIAWLLTKHHANTRQAFLLNLEIAWSLTLIIGAFLLAISLSQ
jgi:hypothetical protein